MRIPLSDHFTYKKLLLLSLSPIGSMLFTSLYGIVDGFFVSNHAGATAFASLNLVFPFIMLLSGVGFMFGTGGSALVAFHLGRQEVENANRYFSLIVYTTAAVGITLGAVGYLLTPLVLRLLGATPEMEPYCALYLRINMLGIASFMLQQLFETFFITAEQPQLVFRVTLIAGCTNMLLDWLLVGCLKLGIAGAAWATVLSQTVGGLIPLLLFTVRRDWLLHLGRTRFELWVLAKTCGNGISEFLSNISASVVGVFANLRLLKYAGENGVSAYGVIMYVSFIFVAIYLGYTMGVSPAVSYHLGAENTAELKNLYRKSLRLLGIMDLSMVFLGELTAVALAKLFVGYDAALCALTVRGLRIFSLCYLVFGINIFSSAFFTALNNGRVSAVISVSRTLVFELLMLYALPALLEIDGVWAVAPAVEVLGLLLSMYYFRKYGKVYGYR